MSENAVRAERPHFDPSGPQLLEQLQDLTLNLRSALDRFRLDSRLTRLAEKEVPDARERLMHVLKLTDQAAHRTLDLVEQSCPPADRIAKEAAALVGRSLRTWRSWDAGGRVPRAVRIGRSVHWRAAELRAWTAAGCPSRKHWEAMQ